MSFRRERLPQKIGRPVRKIRTSSSLVAVLTSQQATAFEAIPPSTQRKRENDGLYRHAHDGSHVTGDRFAVTVSDPEGADLSLDFVLTVFTSNDAPTQAGSSSYSSFAWNSRLSAP